MSAHRVFCQAFLGLPTGAFPSTTNLVHAFTCRQTECSARPSSAWRQEPSPPPPTQCMPSHVGRQSVLPGLPRPGDRRLPLHHQPSACLHMSADRVFCQVFPGLATGALPSTTNPVHAFTCRQTECSARSSSAWRQAPSPPPPTQCMPSHVGRQSVLTGLPRPGDRRLPLHHQPSACLHMSADRVFCQAFLGLPTGAFPSTTNPVHAFTCRQTVFRQVLLGLSTGAFPSTTNLVHAFTCRHTECSARPSSACRQAPSPPPPT